MLRFSWSSNRNTTSFLEVVYFILLSFVILRIFKTLRDLCIKRKLSQDEVEVAAEEEEEESFNKSSSKMSSKGIRRNLRSLSQVAHDSACYYERNEFLTGNFELMFSQYFLKKISRCCSLLTNSRCKISMMISARNFSRKK